MKIIWTEILKFLEFLILKNFSRILEKFHFSISISRQFHFTFHSRSRFWGIFISLFTLDLDIKAFSFHFSFSKWVKLIFISLFTSRNEWNRFSFHFSLLDFPISTLAGHWSVLFVVRWPSVLVSQYPFSTFLWSGFGLRLFFPPSFFCRASVPLPLLPMLVSIILFLPLFNSTRKCFLL